MFDLGLIVFGIWTFMCAIAASVIAGDKHRDEFTWFIVSALLGPIALITLASLKEGTVGKHECPECKEYIKSTAKVCSFCSAPQVEHVLKTG
jgi:hypothetical protein